MLPPALLAAFTGRDLLRSAARREGQKGSSVLPTRTRGFAGFAGTEAHWPSARFWRAVLLHPTTLAAACPVTSYAVVSTVVGTRHSTRFPRAPVHGPDKTHAHPNEKLQRRNKTERVTHLVVYLIGVIRESHRLLEDLSDPLQPLTLGPVVESTRHIDLLGIMRPAG